MGFRIINSRSIVLPPLPAWSGPVHPCTWLELSLLVHRYSPACRIEPAKDQRFVRVPVLDLKAMIAWSLKFQAAIGGFKPEARDCDDFADAFDLAASWMARAAGHEAAPLVGCISVHSRFAFAGVPGDGGGHALNLALTDAGPWVIEPQNGQATPLELYPNRHLIFALDGL